MRMKRPQGYIDGRSEGGNYITNLGDVSLSGVGTSGADNLLTIYLE